MKTNGFPAGRGTRVDVYINLLTWYEGDHAEYIRQSAVNWFIRGIFEQIIS